MYAFVSSQDFSITSQISVPPARSHRATWEAPTLAVIALVYGGWFALTWFHTALPWWLVLPLGGWLVAWHGSVQHEIIHGHPTPYRRLNSALAWLPLTLWLPYPIYRDSHIAHHRTGALTSPLDDSESFYVTAAIWRRLTRLARWVLMANNTLPGRLVIGPPLTLVLFVRQQGGLLLKGDGTAWRVWLGHGLFAGIVGLWLIAVCRIPLWQYVLLYVYPGLALTLLRSFAEHRPAADQDHRTAIVEGGPLTRLLFLNLNLHAIHHEAAGLPWYALPAVYRRDREAVLVRNGGYRITGYGSLLMENFLTPRDHPVHPDERAAIA